MSYSARLNMWAMIMQLVVLLARVIYKSIPNKANHYKICVLMLRLLQGMCLFQEKASLLQS